MRDLYTITGSQAILDENGDAVLDQFSKRWADENITTENIWGDEELVAGAFVHLGFSGQEFYYSTLDIDMVYESNRYFSGDIKFDSISFASDLSVDRATIQIENVSKMMSAMLLSNDQLGRMIAISFGAVSTTRLQIYDLVKVFRGELYGWTLTGTTATLNMAGLMARWNKRTLRLCQSSCPWPYKSTECGYTGSGSTCSQTWSRCRNKSNFGGFPHLAKLQESKIYWGKNPP